MKGTINENNPMTGRINFGNTPSLLNHFRVAINSFERSVFFALKDATNINTDCASNDIYFSNRDRALHAGRSYDFENPPAGITLPVLADCRVAVTDDLTNLAGLVSWCQMELLCLLAWVQLLLPLARLFPPMWLGCENITPVDTCYYADFSVELENLDEAPQIAFSGTATAFAGSDEGVASILPAYTGIALPTPVNVTVSTTEQIATN